MMWLGRVVRIVLSPVLLSATLIVVSAGCGSGSGDESPKGPAVITASATGATSLSASVSTGSASTVTVDPSGAASTEAVPTTLAPVITVTVVYDNLSSVPDARADWGFACLVEGFSQTVLFDTGADGGTLLHNMNCLGIAPEDIDAIVLSHEHRDHTGGLADLVALRPGITVYHPAGFSQSFVRRARDAGATLVAVTSEVSLCAGLAMMRPQGDPSESGLLITTVAGPVLVTGCAHPGVAEMAETACETTRGPLHAVIGGFHLASNSVSRVGEIIERLHGAGVRRCGPAHCTGERATAMLRQAFGSGFIEMGVGKVIRF